MERTKNNPAYPKKPKKKTKNKKQKKKNTITSFYRVHTYSIPKLPFFLSFHVHHLQPTKFLSWKKAFFPNQKSKNHM